MSVCISLFLSLALCLSKQERKEIEESCRSFLFVCVCVSFGVHNECFIVSVGWRAQYNVLLSNLLMFHWWGPLQCINADVAAENAIVQTAHTAIICELIQSNWQISHRSQHSIRARYSFFFFFLLFILPLLRRNEGEGKRGRDRREGFYHVLSICWFDSKFLMKRG